MHLTTRPSLTKSQAIIPGLSDHDMVVSDAEIRPTYNPAPPRKVYSFGRANWDAIREETKEFTQKYLEECEENSVDANWEVIKKHLMHCLDKHIPSKYKSSRYNLPWLTYSLRRQTRRKRRLYNKARKSKKDSDWASYRRLKKHLKNAIKKAHSDYIDSVLTNALSEGNNKPFWNYVKNQRKVASGVAPLKHNGTLHSSSSDKAEILSQQFSSVFTRDKMDSLPPLHGNPSPDIADLIITTKGVEKLLSRLVSTKASGPDNIPNQLLKEVSQELAPALASLFNQSICTGQHPEDWRKANVSPIFKKDDKHAAANYRPVSLTCVCSKLLEHIVVSHLMGHLEEHQILTKLQHGFRQKHSCTSQLILTTAELAEYYDNNTQVDISILDFSKAFDVVSHRKLLYKLEHYGINGKLLEWIRGFLTGRTQCVVVDGVASKPANVLSGVPQGTCLGPILFLCYINDITHDIQSQLRLFADDALLYRPIRSELDHQILNNDLKKLEQWALQWDMNFNPKKCYILSLKRTGVKSIHMYSLCNVILKTVSSIPYLGVLLSEDMTYTDHIRKICSKASRTLGFLSRNLKHCPPKLRETAYISMCRSILEYAAPIWDPYLVSECDQIEKVQRRGARFVKRDYRRTSSVTEMLRDLKWEPMSERRKKARLALMFQIVGGEVAVPADIKYLKPGRRGRYIHLNNYQGYKHSYFPRTIRDYNELSTEVRASNSLESFKARLPPTPY